ncbi:MAG: hypothetical protein WDN69_08800 [Aliidongia sp.]
MKHILAGAALLLIGASPAMAGATLDAIKSNGVVACGLLDPGLPASRRSRRTPDQSASMRISAAPSRQRLSARPTR